VIEGDIICILLGCCHPVILWKVEDHYINLGEIYVDGYMYGEAMGMLEREELKLEDFELSWNKNRLAVPIPPANVSDMFGRKHKFICQTCLPSTRTGTPATVHQLPHLTHCHLHPPPSFHRCPRITQHYDPDTIPQRQQNLWTNSGKRTSKPCFPLQVSAMARSSVFLSVERDKADM
jgi:hypothetical protein